MISIKVPILVLLSFFFNQILKINVDTSCKMRGNQQNWKRINIAGTLEKKNFLMKRIHLILEAVRERSSLYIFILLPQKH